MRLYRRLQCTWQLLTKIDIRAQVEPAVEPSLPVVSDPMRLARCGFFAVTKYGPRRAMGTLCHINLCRCDEPTTTGLQLLLDRQCTSTMSPCY